MRTDPHTYSSTHILEDFQIGAEAKSLNSTYGNVNVVWVMTSSVHPY